MPTHTEIKASAVSRDHTEIAYWTSGDGHIVNRWRALSSAGVVRSWSVVSPHSPGPLVIANPVGASVSSVLRPESGSYALSAEVTAFSRPRLLSADESGSASARLGSAPFCGHFSRRVLRATCLWPGWNWGPDDGSPGRSVSGCGSLRRARWSGPVARLW